MKIRTRRLCEEFDIVFKDDVDGDGNDELLVSKGLKVIHSKSGIRYTVYSVKGDDIVLRSPEGKRFMVHKDEFKGDYKVFGNSSEKNDESTEKNDEG